MLDDLSCWSDPAWLFLFSVCIPCDMHPYQHLVVPKARPHNTSYDAVTFHKCVKLLYRGWACSVQFSVIDIGSLQSLEEVFPIPLIKLELFFFNWRCWGGLKLGWLLCINSHKNMWMDHQRYRNLGRKNVFDGWLAYSEAWFQNQAHVCCCFCKAPQTNCVCLTWPCVLRRITGPCRCSTGIVPTWARECWHANS